MFCGKKIEVHTVNTPLPSALIPREMLVDFTQASKLIEHAQAQARSLIEQTQAQCERVVEDAREHFWQRANPILQRWESERQAMHEGLEQVATSVINTAIRGFLDETVPPQRISALLNQLLAAQLPPVSATLLCHPQDREAVEQWLARRGDVPWTPRVDNEVSAQSLLLETEDGGLHINWVDALDHLIPPPLK
ncbi:type III secretion protein [Pseudomonas azotoformans]|uniref:Type III secretion protein n=1 Tax=Pseudomonas azotoformans TaxID=47878 RepID=A0A1V2JA46_PSEAZ|nr:type III secretion protein [Pseudomonas azotoformans]ONH41656.1 type III secretion protein [Pseudomonas azotoformans]